MLRSGLYFRWGGGRDPSPLTPEVVCVFKMATPYVTDETGGECGRRGAASPRALGTRVRTWKGVCAPPILGPLLCPALRTAFPIHSLLGVLPAPPSGLDFRGLCFRSPKPWGPSMLVPAPGSYGPLAFLQQLKLQYLFWVLQPWGLLHSRFPPIPTLLLSPPPFLSYTCFLPYHSHVLILFLETMYMEDLIAT